MHISDMYPDHPGQEVFTIHENEDDTVRFKTPGVADARCAHGRDSLEAQPGVDVTGAWRPTLILATAVTRHGGGPAAFETPGGMR